MREGNGPAWTGELAWSAGGALAAAALLTLLGPFGTYDSLELGRRAAFWFIVVPVIWLQAELVLRLLTLALRDRLPLPGLSVPLLGALTVSLPATAVVVVTFNLLHPDSTIGPLAVYWQVLLLLAVIAVIFPLVAGSAPATEATPETDAEPAVEPVPDAEPDRRVELFRRRLPPELSGDILCLEMEDHYLRVHTTEGHALILCRMADAEQELQGCDGLRVHRSYWVARSAVRRCHARGRGHELELVNGLRVPVGKTYRDTARAAGLLPARRGTPAL